MIIAMTPTKEENFRRWLYSGFKPTDSASLAAYRFLFGILMFVSILRFWANGWIDELYLEPTFHFSYWGFAWIKPWLPFWLHVHFVILATLSLWIAIGFCYRLSIILFFLGFTYVELLEKAAYLNHYYFISLLAFLMMFLPLHRSFSVDAWLRPKLKQRWVPAYVLWTLRLQVAIVYVFAGVAKLNADWLLHAQPLKIWLRAHSDMLLLGPWLAKPWLAHAMSIAGCLFDLSVPMLLLWHRSRFWAFLAVIGFHTLTGMLFPIGMFPWIMVVSASLLLSPSWPRSFLGLEKWQELKEFASLNFIHSIPLAQKFFLTCLGIYFGWQICLPLRHHLYPGQVRWTEEGGRFAWRVMATEKVGTVVFYVRDPSTGKQWRVHPDEYLTPLQAKEMSTQPDMILQFAHHLRDMFQAQGIARVEVRADAYLTLNGRPSRRWIDSNIDLSQVKDTLAPKPWILPDPSDYSKK